MRKHRSDIVIAVLTILLMALGLIVIYAIGPQRANFMNAAYGLDYGDHYFFIHQLVSVLLSTTAFIVAFKFPYAKIRQYAKIIAYAGIIMCAALAFLALIGSSLASCQLGGCRWFNLGPLGSFQPSEFLKLGLVLYLAQLIAEKKRAGKLETRDFFQPFIIICGLALFFVVILQKDLGTGASMIAIILAMLFMSGIKIKIFGIVVGVVLLCGALSIVTSPHRMQRLLTFGGGESADSYHIDNAMLAIGTGGFLGVGIGNSVQATGYLPESINDSVFAVMGETFGFVGLLVVIGIFFVLLSRLLKMVGMLDTERSLVVVGVFAWMTAHVVINIAAMTGLMPLTGITLPLLSYGGTSMIFLCLALGLVLQLSCYTGREVKDEDTDSRRGVGRSYHTSRRRSA